MSHQFFEGNIYHKRFIPKVHDFKYKFFYLDIDVDDIENLNTKNFSVNALNIFSFYTKDHFGKTKDFKKNIHYLLEEFELKKNYKMRFITLPRIINFVFNPISLLVLFEEDIPKYLLAEVHNYNNGRIVYKVPLEKSLNENYFGKAQKSMYVSPFFKVSGDYFFVFEYKKEKMSLKIDYFEENKKSLTSVFSGKKVCFSKKNINTLFFKHTFLTLFVVTRTLWQSFKLYKKGLKWNSCENEDDMKRRY